MKTKVVIFILVVVCVMLAVIGLTGRKQAEEQHKNDLSSISEFSNQVVTAHKSLVDIGQVNLTLSNDLASSQQQITLNVEQMTTLSNSLAAANSTLTDTKTTLASAQETVGALNTRIADLEAQNKVLDAQAQSLSNQLMSITREITETKAKLAAASGKLTSASAKLAASDANASFLQRELEKQIAAKAELEHKFNDLDELRAEVRKIKDQMFVARHEQLMKYDNGGKRGAELLMQRSVPVAPAQSSPSRHDLNVEVGSDGSVKVISPQTTTNRPAH